MQDCNSVQIDRYKKKIILFPAGASGNFLAEFLSISDSGVIVPSYRIDWKQFSSAARFIEADDTDIGRQNIITEIVNGDREFILSHRRHISDLRDLTVSHWVRKIFPLTNKFGFLKNVFYKKQTLEKVDWQQAHFRTQLDGMLMNLQDFYQQLSIDDDLPKDLVIDFSDVLDINFLDQLWQNLYHMETPKKKLDFAMQYISLQPVIQDCTDLDLEDIIDKIQPKDLFDLASVLFLYEKNHNTVDCNRLWTIDDIPESIDGALEFLRANCRNYMIFR